MAEETKAQDPNQDPNQNPEDKQAAQGSPQPEFNVEAMRQVMKEEIQQAMSTIDKDQSLSGYNPQQADPHQSGVNGTGTPQPTDNPLKAVLDPYIQPQMQAIGLIAEGAKDAAIFYGTHPEALECREDIEKAFNALVRQGTPFTRDAVWKWYRGEHFDKFYQKKKEADEQKLNQAGEAVIVGSGPRPIAQVKDAHSATDEELEKGLKDVAF